MNDEHYDIRNGDAKPDLFFLCDHASNRVPEELGRLGLPQAEFARHIAYDIGARELAFALADAFEAPAIAARWSRLVVDLNRGADDPTVVMKLSDGEIIPGNRGLDRNGVERRIARYHAPYHAAVAAHIAKTRADGIVPGLISIHSFTPVFRGHVRPWHIGILWDRDGRLARPLIDDLARDGDLVIGDNEPYTGALENDTLYRHGTMNGLPHVLIEVRQDLIADGAGVTRVARRLKLALEHALAAMGKPALHFSAPLVSGETPMDEKTRDQLEAAVFRRLVAHLRNRSDVQNIDLMNLAGFCRNCLGDWYREAAAQKGIALEKDEARAVVYGMPPAEWKRLYQKDASPEAAAQFQKSKTHS